MDSHCCAGYAQTENLQSQVRNTQLCMLIMHKKTRIKILAWNVRQWFPEGSTNSLGIPLQENSGLRSGK